MINFEDDDPDVLDCVVNYMYNLDYDDTEATDAAVDGVAENPVDEDEHSTSDQIEVPADEGEIVNEESPSTNPDKVEQISQISQQQLDTNASLLTNTNVYALADKVDIPSLKHLAKFKFGFQAKNWPHADFPAVIQRVRQCVPPNDHALRDVCVEICAGHIHEIMDKTHSDWPKWAAVFEEDALLTFTLVQQVDHDFAASVADLEELKTENENAKAELKASEGVIDRLIRALNTIYKCRHCSVAFQPVLARCHGEESGYQLRCKLCKTRHTL